MVSIPQPAFRPLKIYPTDPMQGYIAARKTTINIENEPLNPGPVGARLEVIDYDGTAKTFYEQVNLDDPNILMQGGLEPSEADPRFHQQMVYAVAARTLANFDRALGRRINLRKGKVKTKLRLFPHAFRGENAFYDRDLHAILFGYFNADQENPGANLPRQTIFTCLSHDITAHEMTHAIVDRLRRYFLEPSNIDVLAFHEGFADIVALFQHFSFRDLLAEEIQRRRGNLRQPTVLVQLARQFGYALGTGKSLRSALDDSDARLYDNVTEPHDRGAILVAAVFDGFFATYQARISDLIRIATGGTGELPPGDLHPDLVNRIATEAARTAQRQLDMCIRAFDYLPPVDITFGDYLRALVTADFELNPEDEWGQRAALIEGFRRRGIYPTGVTSLAEESLRWPVATEVPPLTDRLASLLPQLLREEARRFSKQSTDPTISGRSAPRDQGDDSDDDDADQQTGNQGPQIAPTPPEAQLVYKEMRDALLDYARNYAEHLFLRDGKTVFVDRFNAVFRTAPSGGLLIELVAQFVETDHATQEDPEWGGIPFRGGTTIIVGIDGTVRYVIAKPLSDRNATTKKDENPVATALELQRRELNAAAVARRSQQLAHITNLDLSDPNTPYFSHDEYRTRMKARMSLRALHEGAQG
jgi:hypothetical protein